MLDSVLVRMFFALFTCVFGCFIVLLPFLIGVVITHQIFLLRLRSAANRFLCVNCGLVLGRDSLALADLECTRLAEERRKKHPHVKFKLAPRELYAICSKCGTHYEFVQKTGSFEVITNSVNQQ
jgi:hypothetical protein